MRHIFGLVACAVLMLANLMAAPSATASPTLPEMRLAIDVQEGPWGDVRPDEIKTVLASVATELLRFFPDKHLNPLLVVFDPGGPRVFFNKNTQGQYVVFLSVKDARWDQFAYQFSHELCHVLSNHDHRELTNVGVARDNQWFEEAVCEAVSIVSLQRMASSWESSPQAAWRDYAPAFREYAQRRLSLEYRQLAPGMTLAAWFRQNQDTLRADPYQREKTELVANTLFGLFERDPASLAAIGFLNEDKATTAGSFGEYLMSWRSCCPPTQQSVVLQTMAMFGINSEPTKLSQPNDNEAL